MAEIDDYVSKIRLLSNNGHPKDLDFIIIGIVKFANENLTWIKQKKIENMKFENFDVLKYYNENASKFNDEEQSEIWTSIDLIIGLAAKIKHSN